MVEVLMPYRIENIYQSITYELPLDASEQYVYGSTWKTRGNGFGDLDIAIGYQLLEETVSRPALAAFVTTTLPTGEKNVIDDDDDNVNTYHRPTGQGEIAVNTVLRLRRVMYPYSYSISAGYKFRTEVTKVMEVGQPAVNYRNGNLLTFSGSFNVHLNDWIAFKNIVDYTNIGKDTNNGEEVGEKGWLIEYLPGVSFQLKKLRFDQGVTIPVKGNYTSADPGYLLILQYTF